MKKTYFLLLLLFFFAISNSCADMKIIAISGAVSIRHGVQEEWTRAAVGDILKPEDSIELRKKSTATILIDGKIKMTIPESVIIDIADIRNLTQEELLLKLAMEQVRSIPPKKDENELIIPRTTTVHGDNRNAVPSSSVENKEIGQMQLNGTKVLYDHGFYATCVLRVKEIFRLHPELSKMVTMHLMVAAALEKMNLTGEALNEYINLKNEQLTDAQRLIVAEKIKSFTKEDLK
jgi:hypothetical protein